MIYLEIITSLVIFIIMAYMSAISTAYLAISEKDFDFDKMKDKKKIKNIKMFLKNSSSFISSLEFGIAFFDLWLGSLIVEIIANPIYKNFIISSQGMTYFIKYLVILITVLVLSYFLYIFAKIIPKTLAIKNKKKIVLMTANFVYSISVFFKPLSNFLKGTEELIMRIFKIDRKKMITYKDSQMKAAVHIEKEKGILSENDSKVISNYLKLDEMTVKDIMIKNENVVAVDLKEIKEKINEIFLKYGFTRIPVYSGDITNIVGILNVKNLFKGMVEDKKLTIEKYIKPCMIVPSGKRIDLLFNEMKKNREHMAIVVKDKKVAVGIVTMEDIIEEIVGNIEDDFEKYKK